MGMTLFRHTSLVSLLIASGAVVMLTGCTTINPERGPASPNGPPVMLDTLNPTAAATVKVRGLAPAQPDSGVPAPSIVSVTRDNWRATPFAVPVSGVQHHPIYTDDKPRFARETARARGEYPTQISSLEVTTQDSNGSLALEGLAAPVRAGWDILRMPVWACWDFPWSVQQSPIDKQPYQRGPLLARKEPITGSPVPVQPPALPIDPNAETVGKTAEEVKKDEAEKNQQKKEIK